MDISHKVLCQAIKKLLVQLESLNKPMSIILLLGQAKQGKSTLLRQSHLKHIQIESEDDVEIYYNDQGLYIELNENWFNQSPSKIAQLIKQINRCHRHYKISGLLYCVNTFNLLDSDHEQISDLLNNEQKTLKLIHQALSYQVNFGFVFTQIDSLAGFSEFYQNDHKSELEKPFGFSLSPTSDKSTYVQNYRKKFESFIESLNQQVINKIHPIRSGAKRTLIREFPLQLASLRVNIQSLIQTVPLDWFSVRAVFFVSAEQGGLSKDRLTKKIKHEYALTIQDEYHQSVNYRPFFVSGAIKAFQNQCQNRAAPSTTPQKNVVLGMMAVLGFTIGAIFYYHVHSSRLLDEASKELVMYETVSKQETGPIAHYHLSTAANALNRIHTDRLSMPLLSQFKEQFSQSTHHHLNHQIVPVLLNEVEQMMTDQSAPPAKRYDALKVYIMLGHSDYFSRDVVLKWFQTYYIGLKEDKAQKRLSLLEKVIQEPRQPLAINQQLITDTRNDLKALPKDYFYYSLSKQHFSNETAPIAFEGFNTSHTKLPLYLTKQHFKSTVDDIPNIIRHLEKERWVLNLDIPSNLDEIIIQAYCYEYVTWWQSFIKRTQPKPIQNYKDGMVLLDKMLSSNTFPSLIRMIQDQTSPVFDDKSQIFNNKIASKFSEISLISQSSLSRLTIHLDEAKQFLNTLSAISDQGQTAFMITKKRFNGDTLSNPLSVIFSQSEQLSPPLSNWTNQLAGDIWYLLIADTREYINSKWQTHILDSYHNQIENHFPFADNDRQEVSIDTFELFFAPDGQLNQFINQFVKPFLDTSHAKWMPKELNNYHMPIQNETIKELMRANVITTMFFPMSTSHSEINFSLQKINLDPVVDQFQLRIGDKVLSDSQITQNVVHFDWPENHANLSIKSVDGKEYQLNESGPWAFFKLLQKVNIILDDEDSSKLQILFEINGNSGRYHLNAHHQLHPFIPGILNDFHLPRKIT